MTRWYTDKKHEHFYKESKKHGYRARSAFKLKQIQNKYKIIKKDDIVIDLGAAPGGWSQVVREIVGEKGRVIGIDLISIQPLNGAIFLKGDMIKQESIDELTKILDEKKADVIISDMSPNISGNYSMDQARSIYLCEQAFKTVEILLKHNGHFICKVFEGEDLENFIQILLSRFRFVKRFSPAASRKSSSEIYIIAQFFKK